MAFLRWLRDEEVEEPRLVKLEVGYEHSLREAKVTHTEAHLHSPTSQLIQSPLLLPKAGLAPTELQEKRRRLVPLAR